MLLERFSENLAVTPPKGLPTRQSKFSTYHDTEELVDAGTRYIDSFVEVLGQLSILRYSTIYRTGLFGSGKPDLPPYLNTIKTINRRRASYVLNIVMPAVIEDNTPSAIRGGAWQARSRLSRPLEYTGSLDSYKQADVTPVIGREYHGLQIADMLNSKDRDQIIKDLALTGKPFPRTPPIQALRFCISPFCHRDANARLVSQRGVVFLRAQDVTPQQMKEFMEHVTELAGCVRVPGCSVPRSSLRSISMLTKVVA